MFSLCNINDSICILFNDSPFTVEELGFTKVKDLSFNKETFSFEDPQFNTCPILHYMDFMFRLMNNKLRTTTHILGELGIDDVNKILIEHTRIQNKSSKLTKSQREKVIEQYNRLIADEKDDSTASADNSNPQ